LVGVKWMREYALEAYLKTLFSFKREVVVTPHVILIHVDDIIEICNQSWLSYEWRANKPKYLIGRKVIPYKDQRELKWLLILYG